MSNEFKLVKIKKSKNDLLIEHYKRCNEFCISYNSTIWSMPSIATAINVGTYYSMFDKTKVIEPFIVIVVLFILFILNLSLTIGVIKHLRFQKEFGNRIKTFEKANEIPFLDLESNGFIKLKARYFYITTMCLITIINFCIFIFKLKYVVC